METQQQDSSMQMHTDGVVSHGRATDYLTFFIADQRFGIPILQVQDVLGECVITKVPLAPPEIAGSLNLRGRIITAINMRRRLGVTSDQGASKMSVVVELDNTLYSLMIDSIGDVIALTNQKIEPAPSTLDSEWRDISAGVYQLDNELMVILDMSKFLNTIGN